MYAGKVEFWMLNSSQGCLGISDPNQDSTNECSVIAGLNVINHISSPSIEDVITDNTIVDIMDNCAPPSEAILTGVLFMDTS